VANENFWSLDIGDEIVFFRHLCGRSAFVVTERIMNQHQLIRSIFKRSIRIQLPAKLPINILTINFRLIASLAQEALRRKHPIDNAVTIGRTIMILMNRVWLQLNLRAGRSGLLPKSVAIVTSVAISTLSSLSHL
jgi:predicted RNA-binding protein YlxR (DUF448 family)